MREEEYGKKLHSQKNNMQLMISALESAKSFLILSVPFMVLLLFLNYLQRRMEKRSYLITEFGLDLLLMVNVIVILAVTVGNNYGICTSFDDLKESIGYSNWIPIVASKNVVLAAFAGIRHEIINVFGNLLMFVPFGFLISIYNKDSLWKRKKLQVVLSSLCLSISIECIQVLMFRAADIDDIILNTIGGATGYNIYNYTSRVFRDWFQTIFLGIWQKDQIGRSRLLFGIRIVVIIVFWYLFYLIRYGYEL